MSEDQRRDDERGRAPGDMSDMFSQPAGGASGRGQIEHRETSDDTVDEDAVEKHRAAKQERVRKRREEMKRRKEAITGNAGGGAGGPGGPGGGGGQGGRPGRGTALPALRPDIKPDTPALRAERVEAIRRDLVRRRRRKGMGTLFKLLLFVILPTIAVGAFLYTQASSLYRSEATFSVKSSEGGGGAGGLLGMLGGGGGSIYDPIAVQTFINSRDVLKRLDAEHGWIAHFQDPELDFWHQLEPTATFEEAFDHYTRFVKVSFDPTEGIIEMSLVASSPEDARRYSLAIIGYAEEMVDQLSDRIRADSLRDSEVYFKEAQKNLRSAQLALADAQKQSEVFSIETEVSAQMALVSQLEGKREAEKTRLASLLRVTSDEDPRVKRVTASIETLDAQIKSLRDKIAGSADSEATLADVNTRLVSARMDVETKGVIFTSALERLEIARSEASRQHRYLAVVSSPSRPDEANYPKKLELTALAFLAFLGFYIIASLTISLIREQASI